jgi:hypothetical protein
MMVRYGESYGMKTQTKRPKFVIFNFRRTIFSQGEDGRISAEGGHVLQKDF